MSISTFEVCGQLAAVRIEIYSPKDGRAHGSLDASVHLCATHTPGAVAAIHDNGLTAYRTPMPAQGITRCGSGFDFTTATPQRFPW